MQAGRFLVENNVFLYPVFLDIVGIEFIRNNRVFGVALASIGVLIPVGNGDDMGFAHQVARNFLNGIRGGETIVHGGEGGDFAALDGIQQDDNKPLVTIVALRDRKRTRL